MSLPIVYHYPEYAGPQITELKCSNFRIETRPQDYKFQDDYYTVQRPKRYSRLVYVPQNDEKIIELLTTEYDFSVTEETGWLIFNGCVFHPDPIPLNQHENYCMCCYRYIVVHTKNGWVCGYCSSKNEKWKHSNCVYTIKIQHIESALDSIYPLYDSRSQNKTELQQLITSLCDYDSSARIIDISDDGKYWWKHHYTLFALKLVGKYVARDLLNPKATHIIESDNPNKNIKYFDYQNIVIKYANELSINPSLKSIVLKILKIGLGEIRI
jgi:hypothetical protein